MKINVFGLSFAVLALGCAEGEISGYDSIQPPEEEVTSGISSTRIQEGDTEPTEWEEVPVPESTPSDGVDHPRFGLPLDLLEPIRVGFAEGMTDERRERVVVALSWYRGVSEGLQLYVGNDDDTTHIRFVVDETFAEYGASGYCGGCCNGAARTANIVLTPMAFRNDLLAEYVTIHEFGHALGLPHISQFIWLSVMHTPGPFEPHEEDARLLCALHNDALGCFDGDEVERLDWLALGFRDRDGPICEEVASADFIVSEDVEVKLGDD